MRKKTRPWWAWEGPGRFTRRSVIFGLLVLLGVTPNAAATVRRVKHDAPGPARDGTTWPTAYTTVQAAVEGAEEGDEVWVAAGTYTENITVSRPISLYGGFAGTEASRDARDPAAGATVLKPKEFESVIRIAATAPGTTVNGFTIREGMGTFGGAIWNSADSVTISDNLITENHAALGGGVYSDAGSVTLRGNTILKNHAGLFAGGGGGIYIGAGSATISHNRIIDNTVEVTSSTGFASADGGGIACGCASVRITGNLIAGNSVVAWSQDYYFGGEEAYGGGISCTCDAAVLANNTIARNSVSANGNEHGGAIYSAADKATLVNNLLALNDTGLSVSSRHGNPLPQRPVRQRSLGGPGHH